MIRRAFKSAFAAALLALPVAGRAAPLKATNSLPQENIKSTFLLPKTQAEGRDPFFPKSTSLYQTASVAPSKPQPEMGLTQLKLKGLIGTQYANINNMTLGVGETEEVKTVSGPIPVHLLAIHAADESVVIEANGQRMVLH